MTSRECRAVPWSKLLKINRAGDNEVPIRTADVASTVGRNNLKEPRADKWGTLFSQMYRAKAGDNYAGKINLGLVNPKSSVYLDNYVFSGNEPPYGEILETFTKVLIRLSIDWVDRMSVFLIWPWRFRSNFEQPNYVDKLFWKAYVGELSQEGFNTNSRVLRNAFDKDHCSEMTDTRLWENKSNWKSALQLLPRGRSDKATLSFHSPSNINLCNELQEHIFCDWPQARPACSGPHWRSAIKKSS